MLKVILELLPHGSVEQKEKLSELHIINDGSGNEGFGNYRVKLLTDGIVVKMKYITNYRRDKGAWSLVKSALEHLERP